MVLLHIIIARLQNLNKKMESYNNVARKRIMRAMHDRLLPKKSKYAIKMPRNNCYPSWRQLRYDQLLSYVDVVRNRILRHYKIKKIILRRLIRYRRQKKEELVNFYKDKLSDINLDIKTDSDEYGELMIEINKRELLRH